MDGRAGEGKCFHFLQGEHLGGLPQLRPSRSPVELSDCLSVKAAAWCKMATRSRQDEGQLGPGVLTASTRAHTHVESNAVTWLHQRLALHSTASCV